MLHSNEMNMDKATILCISDGNLPFNCKEILALPVNINIEYHTINGEQLDIQQRGKKHLKILLILNYAEHICTAEKFNVGELPEAHFLTQAARALDRALPNTVTDTKLHLQNILFLFVDSPPNAVNSTHQEVINRAFGKVWRQSNVKGQQFFKSTPGHEALIERLRRIEGVKIYDNAERAIEYRGYNTYNFFYNQQVLASVDPYLPLITIPPIILFMLYKIVKDAISDELSVTEAMLVLTVLVGFSAALQIPKSRLYNQLVDTFVKFSKVLDRIDGVIELTQEQLYELSPQITRVFEGAHMVLEEAGVTLELSQNQLSRLVANHNAHMNRAITLTNNQMTLLNSNFDKNAHTLIELTGQQLMDVGCSFKNAIDILTQRFNAEMDHTLAEARSAIHSIAQSFETVDRESRLTFTEARDTLRSVASMTVQLEGAVSNVLLPIKNECEIFIRGLEGSQKAIASEFVRTLFGIQGFIGQAQREANQISRNVNGLLVNTSGHANRVIGNIDQQINTISGGIQENISNMNEVVEQLGTNLTTFRGDLLSVAENFEGTLAKNAKNLVHAIDKGIQKNKFKPEVNAQANVKASFCCIM